MFDKILVVCVGNICRSPSGEYLLKSLLLNKTIASAGIAALVDKSADKLAQQVALEHNIILEGHKAQQLNADLCHEFDLILVMESGHIGAVSEIAPEARGKTMLLSHWVGKQDIPDPYRQSKVAFEHVYQLIEKSATAWAKKL